MLTRQAKKRLEVKALEGKEGECIPASLDPSKKGGCDGDLAGDNNLKDRTLNVMSTAMQNPVFLPTIFEHCPVEVLANCRLVSKLWQDLSIPFWRSSVYVMFDYDAFSVQYRQYSKFVKHPKNKCERYPYRQFRLHEWKFDLNLKRKNILTNRFWLTSSNNITFLELKFCYFNGAEEFRKVIFSCPNLQQLVMYWCQYGVDEDSEDEHSEDEDEPSYEVSYGELLQLKSLTIDPGCEKLPVSWMEVLSHFPRLTTLKLRRSWFDYNNLEKILKAIKTIRKEDSRKLVLKHLHLIPASLNQPIQLDHIASDIRTLLTELQLPLETLTLGLEEDTPIELPKEILEIHAPTLRELKVYRIPYASFSVPIPYTRFPCGVQMDSLHKLYLSDTLSSNMEFIKLTPNLKVLHFRYMYGYDEGEDEDEELPCRRTKIVSHTRKRKLTNMSLIHLADLRIDYDIGQDNIRSLMKWMPNVEKLRMALDDKQFSMVCENWTKLVHLHVCGTEISDEGVTGKRFYQENGEEKELPSILPNITCLKDLRTFVMGMGTDDSDPPSKVTDLSAFHGFLKTERLQHLRVRSQMGDMAKEALKAKILHCEFIQ